MLLRKNYHNRKNEETIKLARAFILFNRRLYVGPSLHALIFLLFYQQNKYNNSNTIISQNNRPVRRRCRLRLSHR